MLFTCKDKILDMTPHWIRARHSTQELTWKLSMPSLVEQYNVQSTEVMHAPKVCCAALRATGISHQRCTRATALLAAAVPADEGSCCQHMQHGGCCSLTI